MGTWGVWSLEHACNGMLAGLVSITSGAPVFSEWAALAVGAIGGVVYYGTSHLVADIFRIDDVVDAFAVHGACGLWSLLAVGLLSDGALPPGAEDGALPVPVRGAFAGGGGTLLAAELLGALSLVLWSLAFGVAIFVPWAKNAAGRHSPTAARGPRVVIATNRGATHRKRRSAPRKVHQWTQRASPSRIGSAPHSGRERRQAPIANPLDM